MPHESLVRKSHNLTLEGLPQTPLTNPLAYSPKYLGSATEEIDIIVLLDGLITDPKVSRISASVVLDTMNITYKASIDNLYKEVVLKHSPNGAPVKGLNRVYCQIISKTDESQEDLEDKPVKYYFEVWRTNTEGEIVEQHCAQLLPLLNLLYPTIRAFKVRLGGIIQQVDIVGAILLE
ncbi:hypothetical protein Mithridates_00001 [Acinetobacter phage Mithridates]|nr:hypothetical protein Mithridates_00001 [Acinetobacter phage Mithridates]